MSATDIQYKSSGQIGKGFGRIGQKSQEIGHVKKKVQSS
jgi:hypothetical protein